MKISVTLTKSKEPDWYLLESEDDWYIEDGLLYIKPDYGTYVYNLDYVRTFDVVG